MNNPLPRSPELMSTDDTALLVVDIQEKVVAAIEQHQRMLWNVRRLIDAAELLRMRSALTEHYPKGLGPTIAALRSRFAEPAQKRLFSCRSCGEVFTPWREQGITKVLLAGIETHVCIQQTALDLLADGWRVYLPVDALGARFTIDHETALRRMESAGATLTTTEAAMFEWCADSARPEFKQLSTLVKESLAERV